MERKRVHCDGGVRKKISRFEKTIISIAIPSTALKNACSQMTKTLVVSQIARSAAIFRVAEILIYGTDDDDDRQLMQRLLEYAECPQYLRKYLFKMEKPLKFAGVMAPLTTPHHMSHSETEWFYREGICTDSSADGSKIDIGLDKPVRVEKALKTNIRVTVKKCNDAETSKVSYKLVSPDRPRRKRGLYWGYSVHSFNSLKQLLDATSYDVLIGTSQYGNSLNDISVELTRRVENTRVLIVFGGPSGLEQQGFSKHSFDYYVNAINTRCMVEQGARTIRTEESIPIVLASLTMIF